MRPQRPSATEQQKELARKLYASDEIAIDDDAVVSNALSDGARSCWVQAWVWLADDDFNEEGA